MVWSTNAETHKIDGSTLKLFSMVQKNDKLEKAYSSFKTSFLQLYLWQKKELTQITYSAAKALSISSNLSFKA